MLNFHEPIIEIQAGANHSAFINKNFTLYMSGSGAKGQLGNGEHGEKTLFNVIKVRDRVKKVACGETHTLIIDADKDSVLVCGANDKFQLGNS